MRVSYRAMRPVGVVSWTEGSSRRWRFGGSRASSPSVPSGWWYNMEDVYGFCDGEEPVLVISMLEYVQSGGVSVPVPADVVLPLHLVDDPMQEQWNVGHT